MPEFRIVAETDDGTIVHVTPNSTSRLDDEAPGGRAVMPEGDLSQGFTFMPVPDPVVFVSSGPMERAEINMDVLAYLGIFGQEDINRGYIAMAIGGA